MSRHDEDDNENITSHCCRGQRLAVLAMVVLATASNLWNTLPTLQAYDFRWRSTTIEQTTTDDSSFTIITTKKISPTNASSSPTMIPTKKTRLSSSHRRIIPFFNYSESQATIVVQLAGEIGSMMGRVARARGLQLYAYEHYNITTNLVLRHQTAAGGRKREYTKWITARKSIVKCFPNMRQWNYSQANTPEFDSMLHSLRDIYGTDLSQGSLILDKRDEVYERMEQVVKNLHHSILLRVNDNEDQNTTTTTTTMRRLGQPLQIHMPFIFVDAWFVAQDQIDRYLHDYQSLFAFDEEACCEQLPEADESVFHFRNFATELGPATTKAKNFGELDPNRTAYELFGHLPPGSKIAMTTRFNNNQTQQYVQALTQRGFKVRVITGQSPMADQCFLRNAQKELVGHLKSSFFKWAAYFGKAQTVRGYALKGKKVVENGQSPYYEWKDPELQRRFQIVVM